LLAGSISTGDKSGRDTFFTESTGGVGGWSVSELGVSFLQDTITQNNCIVSKKIRYVLLLLLKKCACFFNVTCLFIVFAKRRYGLGFQRDNFII
jgi:hypothetical protein